MIFDGMCVLCDGFITWLLRRDRRGRYRMTPLQGTTAAAILGAGVDTVESRPPSEPIVAHSESPNGPETLLLVEEGRTFERSDAVLRIVAGLGGPWRMAGWLRIVPLRVRDRVYRWVARNRYQWFGRRESCRLPTPDETARFLP